MRETIRDAALDALAIVLPVDCAGCGAPDRALCPACRAALEPRVLSRTTAGGLLVSAGGDYDGVARRTLLTAKESGRTDVLRALAPLLAAAIADRVAALGGADGILPCPVPSSWSARRRRGYDPVRLLLRAAALPAPRMLRVRSGAAQKTLGLHARAENAAGRMRARRPLDGRRLLLVDDVLTTGATLEEAARAVRAAGGEVVGAAVALSTPRRLPAPAARSETAEPIAGRPRRTHGGRTATGG